MDARQIRRQMLPICFQKQKWLSRFSAKPLIYLVGRAGTIWALDCHDPAWAASLPFTTDSSIPPSKFFFDRQEMRGLHFGQPSLGFWISLEKRLPVDACRLILLREIEIARL